MDSPGELANAQELQRVKIVLLAIVLCEDGVIRGLIWILILTNLELAQQG